MGTTTSNISIYIPSSGEELYRASFAQGQNYIDLHRHTGPPTGGAQLISGSYSPGSITPGALSNQVRQQVNYVSNFGISYSGGLFSITSADGSPLSLSNLAFVTFQNQLNIGQSITISLNQNETFLDHASGSSQIAGNLFGRASGIDSLADVQFYIYAVINTTNTAMQIMISTDPCQIISPDAGNIGMPSIPNASFDFSFFSLGNVTASDYAITPAVQIGCFRMRKVGGAANDWSVQGLTTEDGIGACSCGGGSSDIIENSTNLGTSNIGISYSAGTFSINGSNGAFLEPTNKGLVFMPGNVAGTIVRIEVTDNQIFKDNVLGGSSTIAGNLFGLATSVDYSSDIPFFIYAVLDSEGDRVVFMISRKPIYTAAPVAAKIATTGNPIAATEDSFFALDDLGASSSPNPLDYQNQPALIVGSFRMTKVAGVTNDWLVSALSISDGIDLYQEQKSFNVPVGSFGAKAGSFFETANAPTVTGAMNYQISRDGLVTLTFDGTAQAAGTNHSNAILVLPFLPSAIYTISETPVGQSYIQKFAGSGYTPYIPAVQNGVLGLDFIVGNGTTDHLFNDTAFVLNDTIRLQVNYRT